MSMINVNGVAMTSNPHLIRWGVQITGCQIPSKSRHWWPIAWWLLTCFLFCSIRWFKHSLWFTQGDCGVGERVVKEKEDQMEGPAPKKRERWKKKTFEPWAALNTYLQAKWSTWGDSGRSQSGSQTRHHTSWIWGRIFCDQSTRQKLTSNFQIRQEEGEGGERYFVNMFTGLAW